jgi:hypothetical protein
MQPKSKGWHKTSEIKPVSIRNKNKKEYGNPLVNIDTKIMSKTSKSNS